MQSSIKKVFAVEFSKTFKENGFMDIKYYGREEMINVSKELVKPCNILVDIGCGLRPYIYEKSKIHVCIEPYEEYINIAKSAYKDYNMVFIKKDALSGLKLFPDNSVDTVIMLDFIEHVEKEEGFEILKEADRIARKQIVVFTPLGFVSNDSGEKDNWGLDGVVFQEHKSGWYPEDFGEDWEINISKDFYPQKKPNPDNVDFYGCIWAVKNKNVADDIDINKVPDFIPYEINIRKQIENEAVKATINTLLKKYKKEELRYNLTRFFVNLIPFKKIRKKLRNQNKDRLELFFDKCRDITKIQVEEGV